MARNLFGGSVADVAETTDGSRVPSAVGTVWDGLGDDAAEVTDLLDLEGEALTQLSANEEGMVGHFYGPDGVELLYVDFGAGRVALVPVDVGARFNAHQEEADPHGYGDRFLDKTTDGELSGSLTVHGIVTAEGLALPAISTRFIRGAVVPAPTGAVTYVLCSMHKDARIVAVKGYRSGGTGATINAQRNGLDVFPTDLSLSMADTWASGPVLQNEEVLAGDSIAISVRGVTGTPAYVTFQIEFEGV